MLIALVPRVVSLVQIEAPSQIHLPHVFATRSVATDESGVIPTWSIAIMVLLIYKYYHYDYDHYYRINHSKVTFRCCFTVMVSAMLEVTGPVYVGRPVLPYYFIVPVV